MRKIVFGYDQQSRRVLVDAVDDAGAALAADAGKTLAAVIQQGVDERAVLVAGRGMHHHAARLVHDDEIVVLVHDVERDVLCSKRGLRSVRQQNLKHVARGSFVIFLHGRAVFRHGALLQQPLGSAARESRNRARKESVDAFGALLCL